MDQTRPIRCRREASHSAPSDVITTVAAAWDPTVGDYDPRYTNGYPEFSIDLFSPAKGFETCCDTFELGKRVPELESRRISRGCVSTVPELPPKRFSRYLPKDRVQTPCVSFPSLRISCGK